MLPTPDTSHVPYSRVYEPAEDSFLLLDTLSSSSETSFLSSRFQSQSQSSQSSPQPPCPLVLELGPGSGVVLAFLTAQSVPIFSRPDVLTLGIDINWFACSSTNQTVALAAANSTSTSPSSSSSSSSNSTSFSKFQGTIQADLISCLRPHQVDVLVFNPPYVPTDQGELPAGLPKGLEQGGAATTATTTFEQDSALLALSYAGGRDGMEVTDRVIDALPEVLSDRGVAYILLCAGNKPEEVKSRIRDGLGGGDSVGKWKAETVGTSGRQAGWEKLQIVRIWRE